MTDEYINKKDVVNLAVMMQTHLWTREQTYNAIFCLPSADVAPVRHGRWEAIEWGENRSGKIIIGRGYQCSECRRIVDLEYDETLKDYPYCHCGAKMDGEVDA